MLYLYASQETMTRNIFHRSYYILGLPNAKDANESRERPYTRKDNDKEYGS